RGGFDERLVFDVDATFDWNLLRCEMDSLSLFASQRLIELRMPGGKPGKGGSDVIKEYCRRPPPGVLLLISTGKLESKVRSTAWYKAIESSGVVVQVWPVELSRLPSWIRQRAANMDMQIDEESSALLAQRVEGNMLACNQELEKLLLIHGQGAITLEQVMAAVFDSTKYTIYTFVDSALTGDRARTMRILRNLRGEGVAPPLLVWALGKDLRILCRIATAAVGGGSPEPLWARFKVWESRRPVLRRALQRHTVRSLQRLVRRLGKVDRIIKGQDRTRDPWDELTRLGMALAGVDRSLSDLAVRSEGKPD
ncbi:MAG: DNA polymerase III subunit delta, partial [Gammaproteobacteria bacterium]|nr:DNA polymerase III subunit delta [Gammaproteobacteria bacterium]